MISHQHIVDIFHGFLTDEYAICSSIHSFYGDKQVNNQQWLFTLPNLYQFMCSLNTEYNKTDYAVFRKLLFHNPTQVLLKEHGGEVSIYHNEYNIDKTIYVLKKISAL